MARIKISVYDRDYEVYAVPDEVAKALVTLLKECENSESEMWVEENDR